MSLSSILHEYSDESDDAVDGICHAFHECGKCTAVVAEVLNETSTLKNPEQPVMEVPNGAIEFKHVDFAYNSKTVRLRY